MVKDSFRPFAKIIAIVLGFVIFKHFNFKTLTLKDPFLDALYILTLGTLLFFLFKKKKSA